MSIDQHNEAMAWTQALLQNSARPSGALIYDGDTALSDDEFNRLKAEIENQYSGAKNAGRPMLLEGGLDWKPMGLSPEDMQTGRTSDAAARNIALTFGVPPLLLNIPGDNTFANYREARLGFYEDTILPLVDYMLDQLNAWLSPQFGDVEIHPDLASIEAIAEKRYKMWEIADNSDDLTLNESRQLKGLPPMPDPLGSTLMVDIRRSKGADPEQTLNDALKGAAYGTVR
jgi:HK97 family phage portal protein